MIETVMLSMFYVWFIRIAVTYNSWINDGILGY